MDHLIEYIGKSKIDTDSNISLNMLASMTISILSEYIEGMESDGEYDIDDYFLFDEWLSANPCVLFHFGLEGEPFSSLKDLAKEIINELALFSKYIIDNGWETEKKHYSFVTLEDYNKDLQSIEEAFNDIEDEEYLEDDEPYEGTKEKAYGLDNR